MMKHLTVCLALATAAISVTAQSDCTLQYDGNGDGNVNSTDMLGLLSEFGLSCLDTTTIDTVASHNCGDPIFYQGYDYTTVLIGEQCWFAENLRSENYANGEAIPSQLSDNDWGNITVGATAVFGENEWCAHDAPNIDACDPEQSLNEYGRLYNWYAVDDARGLCPSGWHVPTDGEWMTMEMALGMSADEANSLGQRGNQGTQLKNNFGWEGGGNGTNSSGFAGVPGGYRHSIGGFNDAGSDGAYWSSSLIDDLGFNRILFSYFQSVYRTSWNRNFGAAVRCIKDSE